MINVSMYMLNIICVEINSRISIRGTKKEDFTAKSALELPLVKGVVSYTVSANTFFPFGNMMGMLQLQISFILSSRSWEIGSSLTGGAGRM